MGSKWKNAVRESNALTIGDNILSGTGAVVLQNMHIGNNEKIGINVFVIRDIPDDATSMDMPVKAMQNH